FHHVGGSDPIFSSGAALKYRATADAWLLRAPERRFTLQGAASLEASSAFSKTDASLSARWFPRPRGDSYEVNARLRAGQIFGQAPLDELFILGLERDTDLWLRAHIATRDGQKGAAPLGRRYGLLNWEVDRRAYASAVLKVKLGPFLDT